MVVQFLAEVYGFQAGQVVEFPTLEEAYYVVESGYAEFYDQPDDPEDDANEEEELEEPELEELEDE